MARFDFYGKSDTPDTTGGDDRWIGIDMTRDRPLLEPGMLSLGENTRIRTGHVIQRKGTAMPGDFNPGFGGALIIGSGVYRNPNGDEILLIAQESATYTIALGDGKDWFKINYDSSVTGSNGTTAVEFAQTFDKVHLLRSPLQGTPAENLVWDGTGDTTGDRIAETDWEITTLSANGLKLVPGVWHGEPFMDRIIFYFANYRLVTGRDTWYLSDIGDYSSYDDVFQVFRTNTGESDYITRIMAYFRQSVVIFKNQSIHMATLQNTYPVSMQQRILNSSLGSVGNKMPLMIGGDIIFLSKPGGFYRLSEVIQDQIATLPVPISEPIQAEIDDINWPVTEVFGCSASLDNYAFFGISVGQGFGTGRLNRILVYDTARNKWISVDKWSDDASFTFSRLHVTNYNGVHRLFAIDYHRGFVYLMYEGVTDDLSIGTFNVPFKMETRGYTGDEPLAFKRFGRATVAIETCDPEITVTAIFDGHNEEKNLTPEPITKNRLEFYPHGRADFDPTTDDANEPKRKDYSVAEMGDFAGIDYEGMLEGEVTTIPGTLPPSPGITQESLERLLVRGYGRWCSLRIENSNGTCEVSSTAVESTRAMNTGRVAA